MKQENILVGCVPPACWPYPVVSHVPSVWRVGPGTRLTRHLWKYYTPPTFLVGGNWCNHMVIGDCGWFLNNYYLFKRKQSTPTLKQFLPSLHKDDHPTPSTKHRYPCQLMLRNETNPIGCEWSSIWHQCSHFICVASLRCFEQTFSKVHQWHFADDKNKKRS